MSWLWAIIVGLVLGVIARGLLPGRQNIPLWLTVVFGLLGSLLGNAVASWIGVRDTAGIDWIRHVLQLAGVLVIVAIGAPIWASIRGSGKPSKRRA